jgi:quercetin dioxygenase-like cupin family protein
MSDCSVVDTGWRLGQNRPVAFEQRAEELAVSLTRVAHGDSIGSASGLAEEMGAVLEGRFGLVSGGESHELSAGDGIVIPRGEERVWRLLSERGVLYRVWRYADVGS